LGFRVPDRHVGAGDDRETDGSGETLVTLGIIVLEADLEFDGFEEVSLLRLERVLKEFLDIGTHSGCGAICQSLLALYCYIWRVAFIPTVIFDMMTVFQ
jgi:hypothetical protein